LRRKSRHCECCSKRVVVAVAAAADGDGRDIVVAEVGETAAGSKGTRRWKRGFVVLVREQKGKPSSFRARIPSSLCFHDPMETRGLDLPSHLK
jgi:hypothetical protein